MASNTPSEPDRLRERALGMIESEFHPLWDDVEELLNDYDRCLQERYRVNVGLVAENTELKRRVRGL